MTYHAKTNGAKSSLLIGTDIVETVHYVYQPVICASTKATLYFEQLARFEDERDQPRRTQTIIEWLEVTGDIIALDIHSFDVAIETLLAHSDINIGVNISGATLSKKDACAEIIALLRNSPEVCPRLYVEVTETHAISNMLYAAEFASALDGLGMQLVVDDFGEGNSTALYLSVLYPAVVKLRMTSGQGATPEILEKAALARTYGSALVVEGLETPEDMLRFPKSLVDFYQGYHVGRPAELHYWRMHKPRMDLRLVSNR
jgi:EAL domain-containing protein (putative c-di-GMP-specific phosphodiesterase class I)